MAVGDFHKEEFSTEELTSMGIVTGDATPAEPAEPVEPKEPETPEEPKDEPEEEPKEPETEKPAEPQDEPDEEPVKDKDGNVIPEKRFEKVYAKAKRAEQLEEKLRTLQRLGPEQYYKLYPDEAPADYVPPERRQAAPSAPVNEMNLKVKGGDYDGYTLKQVFEVDAAAGAKLLVDYRMDQERAKIRQESEQRAKEDKEQQEVARFAKSRAKEYFSTDDPDKLSKEQQQRISDDLIEVTKWKIDTGRTHYSDEDAYYIMRRDGLLKEVKKEAAEKAIKSITDTKVVPSISPGKDKGAETGYEADAKMTPDQLARKIDGMTDKEASKWFKNAPKSLKTKYPSLPWS